MTTNVLHIGKLAAICRDYHIRRLLLFGSALRGPFEQDSDIDLLVEFDPAHIPGWEIVSLQHAFQELFKRPVDLGTPQSLHPDIRERVLASARVIYDESS